MRARNGRRTYVRRVGSSHQTDQNCILIPRALLFFAMSREQRSGIKNVFVQSSPLLRVLRSRENKVGTRPSVKKPKSHNKKGGADFSLPRPSEGINYVGLEAKGEGKLDVS
ncbi:hypothetical protein ACROYT_G029572 [Oculina patagonica]